MSPKKRIPQDVRERAEKLRTAIRAYRREQHEDDESSISPEALDSLKHELVQIESRYPELVTPDSPTQVVAGKPLPGLKKVRHEVTQWSLDDAFDEAEMAAFDERVRRALIKQYGTAVTPTYVCELKIDGAHIILTYKKGELVLAATRGDGVVGEDVTHSVATIKSVPTRLTRPVDLVVEGEVFMSRKGFLALNKAQEKAGKPLFANPRNIVAGSLRQLDPNAAASRPLGIFLYDIEGFSEPIPETQSQELNCLRELGLPVNPHDMHAKNLDEIVTYWKKWQGPAREQEDYQLDGVVVKVEHREHQQVLGHTGKGPRYAIAFKFPAEQVTTVIEDISLQVGRTGVLTPVAHLKPVSVAGTTVARATLHNEDFIKEKDIRIGDTVILQKAGDIIPEIVQVLPEFRSGGEKKWSFPKRSPLCGGDGSIERVPGTAAWRCRVAGSFDQQLRKLAHFAGKSALDIDGLGMKTVKLLMEHELVANQDDFFDLTKDELLQLPGFKEKSAQNLIDSLANKKRVTLDRLLVGLSIPHVGEETARLLAAHFETIPSLLKARSEEFAHIHGIGEVVAEACATWFKDPENRMLLERLAEHLSISVMSKRVGTSPLSGVTVVITGSFEGFSRDEAEAMVRAAGGKVAGSVSRKTGFVVAGEKPGSKLNAAKEFGVSVIDDEEFLRRVKP